MYSLAPFLLPDLSHSSAVLDGWYLRLRFLCPLRPVASPLLQRESKSSWKNEVSWGKPQPENAVFYNMEQLGAEHSLNLTDSISFPVMWLQLFSWSRSLSSRERKGETIIKFLCGRCSNIQKLKKKARCWSTPLISGQEDVCEFKTSLL